MAVFPSRGMRGVADCIICKIHDRRGGSKSCGKDLKVGPDVVVGILRPLGAGEIASGAPLCSLTLHKPLIMCSMICLC